MSSPELVLPNRLEELLAGAFPETEHEARLQGLARELRAGSSPASAALRAKLEGLSAAPRESRFGGRARVALVLALVGSFIAAATTAGLVSDGGSSGESAGTAAAEARHLVPVAGG